MPGREKPPNVEMADGDGGNSSNGERTAGTRGKMREKTRPERTENDSEKDSNSTRASQREKVTIEAVKAIQEVPFEDMTKATWTLTQSYMAYILEHIMELNNDKERLEEQLQQPQSYPGSIRSNPPNGLSPTNSWAKVAQSPVWSSTPNQSTKPPSYPPSYPPSPTPNSLPGNAVRSQNEQARAKQITIRIDDPTERESVAKATISQVIRMFKNGACPESEDIIAARRTVNGDVILNTASTEARAALEINKDWAKKDCPTARILRRTWLVAVHGVRIDAIDTEHPDTIEAIKGENARIHPGLKIVSLSWPDFAKRPDELGRKKRYSTLLIETPCPEMANRLISEGIVEGGALHTCERWERSGGPRQCFNCQEYGHIQRACKNKAKCGICAKNHQSAEHGQRQKGEAICAVCKGNHESWSRACKIRQEEFSRIKQKLATKPRQYPIPAGKVSSPTTTSNSSGTRSTTYEGEWKTVGPNKRKATTGSGWEMKAITPIVKRGVGRPTRLSSQEQGQRALNLGSSFQEMITGTRGTFEWTTGNPQESDAIDIAANASQTPPLNE